MVSATDFPRASTSRLVFWISPTAVDKEPTAAFSGPRFPKSFFLVSGAAILRNSKS